METLISIIKGWDFKTVVDFTFSSAACLLVCFSAFSWLLCCLEHYPDEKCACFKRCYLSINV